MKSGGGGSHSAATWDFFRFAVPVLFFMLGWFLSAQVFARSMNGDSRVVGHPSVVMGLRVYSVFVFLAAVVKHCTNPDFQGYIFASLVPLIVCAVSGLLFTGVWGVLRTRAARARTLHGTARMATRGDLRANGLLADNPGVVLGQVGSARVRADKKGDTALRLRLLRSAQFVTHSGKANTLLLAPTGSGKGVSVIIPTLLSYGGSMIIFDPKGENYNITGGWRRTFSHVIRFSPTSDFTVRFNPVMAIRDGDEFAFRDANLIADILFAPPKAGSSGTEEYFSNSAKDLVTTALLHIRFCDDVDDKDRSLGGLLHLLSDTDGAQLGGNSEEQSTQGDAQFMAMVKARHRYRLRDDGAERVVEAASLHRIIAEGAGRVINTNPKEKASVFKTVFSKLQLFADPMLANATGGNDFEIEDFIGCDKPISLYLTVPYSDVRRISPVFKLLISFMLRKFSEGETRHGSVKLRNHLLFLLDEFPVLGYFPDIAEVMGVLRGYGVNFLIVCQALGQLVDIYGQNHPFLDHCVVQAVFAPGSTRDAEEFSQAIGNRTFSELKVSSSGRRFSGSSSYSFNENSAGQRLLDAADIKRMPGDRCLVLAHGMQPYMAVKCVYYEDARFRKKLLLKPPLTMRELRAELSGLPSAARRREDGVRRAAARFLPVREVRGRGADMEDDGDLFMDDEVDTLSLGIADMGAAAGGGLHLSLRAAFSDGGSASGGEDLSSW